MSARVDFGLALAAFALLVVARLPPAAVALFTALGGWWLAA